MQVGDYTELQQKASRSMDGRIILIEVRAATNRVFVGQIVWRRRSSSAPGWATIARQVRIATGEETRAMRTSFSVNDMTIHRIVEQESGFTPMLDFLPTLS